VFFQSEGLFVALDIRHAVLYCHLRPACLYDICTLSYKRHDLKKQQKKNKKNIEHKMCLRSASPYIIVQFK